MVPFSILLRGLWATLRVDVRGASATTTHCNSPGRRNVRSDGRIRTRAISAPPLRRNRKIEIFVSPPDDPPVDDRSITPRRGSNCKAKCAAHQLHNQKRSTYRLPFEEVPLPQGHLFAGRYPRWRPRPSQSGLEQLTRRNCPLLNCECSVRNRGGRSVPPVQPVRHKEAKPKSRPRGLSSSQPK